MQPLRAASPARTARGSPAGRACAIRPTDPLVAARGQPQVLHIQREARLPRPGLLKGCISAPVRRTPPTPPDRLTSHPHEPGNSSRRVFRRSHSIQLQSRDRGWGAGTAWISARASAHGAGLGPALRRRLMGEVLEAVPVRLRHRHSQRPALPFLGQDRMQGAEPPPHWSGCLRRPRRSLSMRRLASLPNPADAPRHVPRPETYQDSAYVRVNGLPRVFQPEGAGGASASIERITRTNSGSAQTVQDGPFGRWKPHSPLSVDPEFADRFLPAEEP